MTLSSILILTVGHDSTYNNNIITVSNMPIIIICNTVHACRYCVVTVTVITPRELSWDK